MEFASNNPFRRVSSSADRALNPWTQRAPPSPRGFGLPTLPQAPAMAPSLSAPGASYSLGSRNPFLDLAAVDDRAERPRAERGAAERVPAARAPLPPSPTTPDSLLLDLSTENEPPTLSPPPPPPPRGRRGDDLPAGFLLPRGDERAGRPDRTRGRYRRNSESSVLDVREIDSYMPLERDNRRPERRPDARRDAKDAKDAREPRSKDADPFASQAHRGDKDRRGRPSRDGPRPSPEKAKQRAHSVDSTADVAEKSHKKDRRSKKKPNPIDKIDKLDVTGIFGFGSFHHDGPFDACNPHRNKNKKKAPMLAFPADSENNSLSVAPHQLAPAKDIVSFDPISKADPLHGNVSLGLGSSTFLEGTPASRAAILHQQQQQSSRVDPDVNFGSLGGAAGVAPFAGGSLTRKKSIVHKFMNMSREPAAPAASPPRDRGAAAAPPAPASLAAPPAYSRSRSADSRAPAERADVRLPDEPRAYTHSSPPSRPPPLRVDRKGSGSSSPGPGSPSTPPGPENTVTLLKRVKSLKVGGSRRRPDQ
ncbi:uncharacterized protein V1510DRAFT_302568 [Dipodascopsis tothii]|uniref:uncharacterized protein n=1 Tax=Dipodascopsis tothii TaxID=44089 RepID=UPI0034CF1EC6